MEELNKQLEDLKQKCSSNILLSHIIEKTINIKVKNIKEKILNILLLLSAEKIDYFQLKSQIFKGIPDDIPSLRSLLWKILFNLLPLTPSTWESSLEKSHKIYSEYYNKYSGDSKYQKTNQNKNEIDHPLNLSDKSDWNKYFKVTELYDQILKDIRRTRTNMSFFLMPFKSIKVSSEQIMKNAESVKKDHIIRLKQKEFETNADVMSRMLYIYCKLHPDVAYVQGMNEILAPIFYCFSNDNNEYCINNLEADIYICFENFMNLIKDVFIRKMDKTENGISRKLDNLNEMLKLVDYEVYFQLKIEKIEMHFFAFRWITLFFTQDYEMPDVLRLWDSVLTEEDYFDFLSMIVLFLLYDKKKKIVNANFSEILTVLQSLEDYDVVKLVNGAVQIRKQLNENLLI